jgi:hypothetical protein
VGLNPEQITILGMVLAIGGAGLAKLWVFGWLYSDKEAQRVREAAEAAEALEKMEEDRNFWRDTALQALGHTDVLLKGK